MSRQPTQSNRQSLQWLKQQVSPVRSLQGLVLFISLLSTLLLIGQFWLLAQMIAQAVLGNADRDQLLPQLGLILLLIIGRSGCAWLREILAVRASVKARALMREQLLQRFSSLGPAWLAQQRSGELATEALEQVEAIDNYVARYQPQVAIAVLVPLMILAVVLPYNWAAALIFLVTAPLVPLFMALVGKKAADANRRNFSALSRLGGHFLGLLQGMATIKLFHRGPVEAQAIADNSEQFRLNTMQVLRLAFLSSAVLEFFSAISIALIAVYLGMSFLGHLDFGYWSQPVTLFEALFILMLAPEFYLPLRELGTHYHAKAEAIAASDRLSELLQAESVRSDAGGGELSAPVTCVELERVSLGYADKLLLRDITLKLEKGRVVVIVGPSGVGKTTILNLLLGFVSPGGGFIRVGEQSLPELNTECWWRQVAWVSQHTHLFSGSLRENLLLAKPDASDLQLEQACCQARIWEHIASLPEGLDTPVTEGGGGFSGGQLQRLSLARAFLKDAPVLLMDEPTASLDATSERLLIEGLEALCRDRIVLITTHRPAVLSLADQVYRLESGALEPLSGVLK